MKIAMLISGGVDSAVALYLLKEQGHDVTAFYLKIWLEDELSNIGQQQCPWEEDLRYIRAVCKQVDVPLEIVSLQQEYWDHVVSYTIGEVKAGRTPNPDIFCNKIIKFGFFFDKLGSEFDKVASGHYAQVQEHDGLFYLKTSPDLVKDQTYFLSYLDQEQLSKILFPIGSMKKEYVRKYAHTYNLANKDRKDSQGICFLGKFKFDTFLRYHLGEMSGDIIQAETGKKLGEHKGFWYYTIGQRRGSRLSGGPWYVVSKDIEKNIIYVSNSYYTQDKTRDMFCAEKINWIIGKKPQKRYLQVKVRHGVHIYNANIDYIDDLVQVKLDNHDQGIAPGQFAVFYDKKICLGGGVITKSI